MKSIYLGGAIDLATAEAHSLFKRVGEILVQDIDSSIVIFNPFTAFLNANVGQSPNHDAYIVKVNTCALMSAELGVFIWSGCASFGVPVEIFMRSSERKPFIIINESGKEPGVYMRRCVRLSPGSSIVRLDGLQEAVGRVWQYYASNRVENECKEDTVRNV